MADQITQLLQLVLQETGENDNDWGEILNEQLQKIEAAIAAFTTLSQTGGTVTLTDDQSRSAIIVTNGVLTSDLTIVVPARWKSWLFFNVATLNGFKVQVRTATPNTPSVSIPAGSRMPLITDSWGVYLALPGWTPEGNFVVPGWDVTIDGDPAAQWSGVNACSRFTNGASSTYFMASNRNGVGDGGVEVIHNTDGSANVRLTNSSPGDMTQDRRRIVLEFASDGHGYAHYGNLNARAFNADATLGGGGGWAGVYMKGQFQNFVWLHVGGDAAANELRVGHLRRSDMLLLNNPMIINLATGDVTFQGNVSAYSDARLKTDVETITGALGLVEQMRGVRFTKDERRQVGVIAQEVQKAVPEVVKRGGDGYLTVEYANLVGVLVEAVKELSARVEKLEARA